jgi:hypothetical protein
MSTTAYYCSICVVPGSGFGQVEDTWHFRTAFLLPGTEWVDRMRKFHRRPRELEGGSRIISLWGAGWRVIPGEATSM